MTHQQVPDIFLERLKAIIPPAFYDSAVMRLNCACLFYVRVNTLKISVDGARQVLDGAGIVYEMVPDASEAFCFPPQEAARVRGLKQFTRGEFYLQSLSSMLTVQALDPQPGERVLDLCAAPGSKTSQAAARMNNAGEVSAVEAVRGRFYQLKSVLRLLGVENTQCLCMDGRRFQARGGLFDRVLVDAPCSSEGRFRCDNAKTFAYCSLRKIREMAKKQRGLLLNAGRQVRPGGVLVYSTCTFAPEENEAVVDWFLKKSEGVFLAEPVSFTNIGVYPALTAWEGKTFDSQVQHCARILPGEKTEGFFIAKFRKQ